MTISYLIIAALVALLLAIFFVFVEGSIDNELAATVIGLFIITAAVVFIACVTSLVLIGTGVLTP